MAAKPGPVLTRLFLFLCFLFPALPAGAADLQSETLKAWDASVKITEQRIEKELASQKGFLALDFQDSSCAARERKAVLAGEIPVHRISTDADADGIPVPDGMIHHWRGSVFIPGVPLNFVLSRVGNPASEDTRQEDVLASRVLESGPGKLRLFLKLQRSKIVTVVYNTEHTVRYRYSGLERAFSSSIATKIAEVERLSDSREREKPEGRDRGFLWKMNSYWRYQQVPGGVIVECESMTLSRSIPGLLMPAVRPIINSIARESMQRTLQSLRSRLIQAYKANHASAES